ncbi:MAG: LLM class flavin-dependent oxidoreductase [Candidatus Bathyarchaeota archaeon]|nr:LLM class flavin-dependent oxidoreductase [Candidatus Bathyarchaeota archaeon]MDH5595384.1 LLM class flavin-dependent oxidoreductase [Candidatus Bathyarchaeota archaeon]
MDVSDVKIGTMSAFLPPFDEGIHTIRGIEEAGYDSAWWPDHLMGWVPESIWTPDIVELASYQENPHVFFEALCTLAVVAWNTRKILLGPSVTEAFRRHPAMLAQAFLTLDHVSKGRVILGIGAGEGENVIPYGIEWDKPVDRLEEAIQIVRLLWESDKKVDFDGKFWRMKDAVLGLEPFEKGKYPPIWIAAHGPRMLEITGRLGDGWLPATPDIDFYKNGLRTIRESAKKAGRNSDDITPALWTYTVLDEDHNECLRMLDTPLAKNYMLTLPNEIFERYGVHHPLGENFYGLLDYIPTRYDRKTMLDVLEKVPRQICEDYYLYGTPDEIIGQIEKFAEVGLKHIVLCNMTFFFDASKFLSSFDGMKKVLGYFKSYT